MKRVVIFDSGVGGLSVHAAAQKARPDLEYHFVSDNQAYPYGTKDDAVLLERVLKVIDATIQKLAPDLVVIACNTASTVALPELRSRFDVPFVGVVPAIKPAAQQSLTQRIAILATPATIRREYTQALVDQFATNCTVLKIGSSKLVELAEQKLRGESVCEQQLAYELTPLQNFPDCDHLVLACTHFPLLNKEIERLLQVSYPQVIRLVDSGEAIARRVDSLLAKEAESARVQSATWLTQSLTPSNKLLIELQRRQLPFADVLKVCN